MIQGLPKGSSGWTLTNGDFNQKGCPDVLVTISDKKLILTSDPTTNNGSCAAGSAVENLAVAVRGTERSFVSRQAVDLVAGFETGADDTSGKVDKKKK